MAQVGRPAKRQAEVDATEAGVVAMSVDSEKAEEIVKKEKVKKYRIVIDEQDNSDKNQDVFVTDGKNTPYLIKRGHEVVVPEGVVNVLKESVYKIVSEDGFGNKTEKSVNRFALRVLGEA